MAEKKVKCTKCGTVYLLPKAQRRLKPWEMCPNDDCNGKNFRKV